MKTDKEKLKDLNYGIKVFEKALKDGGTPEAVEWGKKYLEKLKKKKLKLKNK